jgi:NitT/TauT family transport system substrate-binding protein
MYRKSISIFLSTFVLLVASCSKREPSEPKPAVANLTRVSIRFPIPIIEAGQAPFYVAQDNGYYRAEGIEPVFNMGSPELNPVKMVASNQDMFGVLGGPDTLLVARSKGQPLTAIAVLHRNSNFPCLLTLKSSGITKLGQLNGKKIGFFHGHISTDVLHSLLRKNGIRYTEVDTGFNYSQLIGKQIDAEWAFTVTAGLDLPAKGVAVNVINPADYGIVTDGYTLFTTDQAVASSPDVISRFLRATLRGVDYTVAHPREANATLLRRDPKLDPELSLRRLMAYNAVTSHAEPYPAGYMDREMFQRAYDRLRDEKVLGSEFDVANAFTTRFLTTKHAR